MPISSHIPFLSATDEPREHPNVSLFPHLRMLHALRIRVDTGLPSHASDLLLSTLRILPFLGARRLLLPGVTRVFCGVGCSHGQHFLEVGKFYCTHQVSDETHEVFAERWPSLPTSLVGSSPRQPGLPSWLLGSRSL
ncbi:hypothetical protein BDY17DRAFT_114706 [Neohortaea acidophila]|uniref:Uncharacterized protein n=1 Tax=Neohortaea acidophila TaxID=245834 RepID=A0A6A6Q2J3_9PEZI|nr:uncharacterized protein BDY17DRAFT_114706 [Neohortaea acidophila]KAF2485883.1 hypothetical protein BDY17DRAFT_114706 [Neohortaea acidophila]